MDKDKEFAAHQQHEVLNSTLSASNADGTSDPEPRGEPQQVRVLLLLQFLS